MWKAMGDVVAMLTLLYAFMFCLYIVYSFLRSGYALARPIVLILFLLGTRTTRWGRLGWLVRHLFLV